MKKMFLIILFFVSWFPLTGEQNDARQAFRLLSPAEQLEKIFKETNYFGIDYIWHRTVFLENPEAKSLLFTHFNSIEVPRYGDPVGIRYSILDNMLYRTLYLNNKLNRNEELLLVDIYKKHLDYYLKTYKTVDAFLISFEVIIHNDT